MDGTGKVFADGGFQPYGADFAESMAVRGDRAQYPAGDLLVIDPTASRRLALAQQPFSTLVAHGPSGSKRCLVGNAAVMKEHGAERVGSTRNSDRRRKKISLVKVRSCASPWVCLMEKSKRFTEAKKMKKALDNGRPR